MREGVLWAYKRFLSLGTVSIVSPVRWSSARKTISLVSGLIGFCYRLRASDNRNISSTTSQPLEQHPRFTWKTKELRLTPKEFLAAWMQHIPERYEHDVRAFGLFAPRAIGSNSAAVFAILGQSQRQRPRPLPWSSSIKRDFGWDPLLDRQGNRMTWNRRIASQRA